ncbi:MAG: ribbon-helix-helix protein, CopG family [Desertimonas sp.]
MLITVAALDRLAKMLDLSRSEIVRWIIDQGVYAIHEGAKRAG